MGGNAFNTETTTGAEALPTAPAEEQQKTEENNEGDKPSEDGNTGVEENPSQEQGAV